MEPRTVLKLVWDFSRRELSDKKAEEVVVYRLKPRTLLKRGKVPDSRVRGIAGSKYVILVFHKDRIRAYFFNGSATMLSAEDFKDEEKEKFLEEISSEGRVLSRFRRGE